MAYDLEPIRRLYPFDGHHLDIDGHHLHYLDEGSGPAVLMLHGNPTWSFYYRDLILALRDRHRVIVPDHMGCGLSDKPQDYPYRLETHIHNLTRLLDHLKLETLTLIVHDWGGAIGCGWAVDHPDQIDRLVIMNTAAFSGPCPWRIRICTWPVIGPIAVRGFNAFAVGAVHTACLNRPTMTPAVKAGYLLPYDSFANRIAVLRFVQDIPLHPGHPTHACIQRIDRALHHLRGKPMLICWGMRDFCFNEVYLQAWQHRFPDAQTHRFDQAGHYVLQDAGQEIALLVQSFLGDSNAHS